MARWRPAPSALPSNPVIVTAACGQMYPQWHAHEAVLRDHRGFPCSTTMLAAGQSPGKARTRCSGPRPMEPRDDPSSRIASACAVARIRPDVVPMARLRLLAITRWRASGTLRCRPLQCVQEPFHTGLPPASAMLFSGQRRRRCRTPLNASVATNFASCMRARGRTSRSQGRCGTTLRRDRLFGEAARRGERDHHLVDARQPRSERGTPLRPACRYSARWFSA